VTETENSQFNYRAFKRRYKQLVKLYGKTEFEPEPILPEDEQDIWVYMTRKTWRRLSFGSRLSQRAQGSLRPTEDLAEARAFGFPVLDCDFPHERQDPMIVKRQCANCKSHKPLNAFAADKRFPSGVSFYCKECRADVRRGVVRWSNAA
jgi:hypothetical protein